MNISEFVRVYSERFAFDQKLHKARKIALAIDYPIVRRDTYKSGSVEHMLGLLVVRGDWDLLFENREVIGIRRGALRVSGGIGNGILNVEVSQKSSLWDAEAELKPLITSFYDILRGSNTMLLGYGAQPVCRSREWYYAPLYLALRESLAERYDASGEERKSYYCADKLTLTAQSRVSVEVSRAEFGVALMVFEALEPFITALFGNSPLCLGVGATGSELVSHEECISGIPERYRMLPENGIEDMEDYLRYMTNLELLVARRNASYYNPEMTFANFTQERKEDEVMENFFLHERMMQWSAVPDGNTGSIMVQACTQPHEEQLSFAAFVLGIAENLEKTAMLIELPEGKVFCSALKRYAAHYGLGAGWERVKSFPFRKFLEEILVLSEDGLKKRGLSEHVLLAPLRERVRDGKNPAERAMSRYSELGSSGWADILPFMARI